MEEITRIDADEDELYADDLAAKTAWKNFGIRYMFPWQRLVVSNILEACEYQKKYASLTDEEKKEADAENKDSFCKGRQIVLLPTGAGKSLCFQVPALLLDGPTLVIYPLLALMSDQQRRMEEGSLRSVTFRGGQSTEEREENFEKIRNGAKIILANPEVLESEDLLNQLAETGIIHIAIDESHCVSEWGDSFRPSYLNLGKVIKKINPPVITAFTATASPSVLARVSEILFEGEAHVVRSESDRANIHYFVENAAAKKKMALKLVAREAHPMIIFCGTRHKSEDMALELNLCFGQETAKFYHAGLEKSEKENVEKWFYNSKDGVLCATCAYGMGVDKKDIKTVVHLEPSDTAEAYLQEAGRGGRDGSIAKAILIWSPKDSVDFSAYPAGSRKAALKEFAETKDCRRQVLLDALGAEQAVCSGCDLCNKRKVLEEGKNFRGLKKIKFKNELKKLYPKSDWEYALQEIKKNPHYYDAESLEENLFEKFNSESIKLLKKRIWNHADVQQIINQLIENKSVSVSKFLWKNRLKYKHFSKKNDRQVKNSPATVCFFKDTSKNCNF